ncbi:MAG: acyltransferase family protein [Henriciella sp.]
MQTSFNRFDFVRLVFASWVFIYHAVVLSSAQPGGGIETGLAVMAELSIQGFFIVSGALVFGSYERSRNLSDYAGKRVRRLYPAYAVVILIPAVLAGILTLQNEHSLLDVFRYIGANLIFLNFLEPNLPGLFEGQRFTEVNGALWTLKIEVMFYTVLPIIAWLLARLGKYWWVGVAVLIMSAFAWIELMGVFDHPLSPVLARQLPGQMMYFAAGIALWKLWPIAQAQAVWLGLIGGIALILSLWVPGLEALRVLGLAGLIAGLAFGPGPALNVASYGDVSYGVYIVHFPIVQMLVSIGAFTVLGTWGGLVLSAVLVFLASYALWWWVEKPALRRDSHYRTVSTGKAQS